MWNAVGFFIIWSFLVAWRYRTATCALRLEYAFLGVARLRHPTRTGQCDISKMKSLRFWVPIVLAFHSVFSLFYMMGCLLLFLDTVPMDHYLIGIAGVTLSAGVFLGDMTVQLVKTSTSWNRIHAGSYSC